MSPSTPSKGRTFRSLLPGNRSNRSPVVRSSKRATGGLTYTSKASLSDDEWSDFSDGELEKQSFSSYHDSSSSGSSLRSGASSRSNSGSYEPMLGSSRVKARQAVTNRFRDKYARRRRCTQLFGLAIGSTLVIFVMSLCRASWTSSRNVELGFDRPDVAPTWENFPFLKRYHGGIRSLVRREKNVPEYPNEQADIEMIEKALGGEEEMQVDEMKQVKAEKEKNQRKGKKKGGKDEANWTIPPSDVFNPYPAFEDKSYVSKYGPTEECFLDKEKSIRIPHLQAYPGVVEGMPDNIMGSYDLLGIRNDVCFERFGRLGPYGFGYSKQNGGTGAGMTGDLEGSELVWDEIPQVNFKKVNWAAAQSRCEKANAGRFEPLSGDDSDEKRSTKSSKKGLKHIPRTALLIRTWGDYEYHEEDILYLRSLIAELSILSRGEYHVHFLIHIRDENKGIWADEEAYEEVLSQVIPAEFRGMATLWSENQMRLVYPGLEETNFRDLPVHGSYRGSFLPVQHFAHTHPEFDFVWNWELDARYTGHFYHLLQQISAWAAQQPRKLLWERSARFYVPSIHGSWEDFNHMVRVQTEHGTNSKNNIWAHTSSPSPSSDSSLADVINWDAPRPDPPVWGPLFSADDEPVELKNDPDPEPPTSFVNDAYEWGVDEPADLITLNPLFDPAGTDWLLADDVTGYNQTAGGGGPPRRAAIVAAARCSRRLLARMHRETSRAHRLMFTEMWPASVALHHGLKAVYAPHPVFLDRRWPADYVAAVFNGGKDGAAGGGRLSVFSEDRQHNFKGTTWYYNAGFAPNLWRRWLGYKVDNDGGAKWELANEGRMCLPAMLLHPVKDMSLVIQYDEPPAEDKKPN